jgi:hypothetical protein
MWETRAKPEPGRAFRRGSNLEDRAAMPLLPTALIDRIDVGANQIDIRLRSRRLSALLGIVTSAFTCRLGPRLNWERASTPTMIEEIRFAADSPLEGDGFEPSVPLYILTVSDLRVNRVGSCPLEARPLNADGRTSRS